MAHDQDWWTLLRQPNVHAACILQVEGIPYAFGTHALLDADSDPIDTISIGGEDYTYLHMMQPDVSVALPSLKLAAGIGAPTSSTFTLVDDSTDFLLDYFRMEGANRTRMTTETLFNAANMDVVSTTGFAAVGTLYCGRETMLYGAVAAAQFQNLTRGQWGSLAATFPVTDDLSEMRTEITNQKVSDYPRVWKGRWVRLWLVMLSDLTQDEEGVLYSLNAAAGTYTIDADEWAGNVWSGVIEDVSPDDNYCSVALECRDILSKCYGTLNARSTKAQLWVPEGSMIYVPTGRQSLNFQLELYDNAATSPQSQACIATISPGDVWVSLTYFAQLVRASLETALRNAFTAHGYAGDYNNNSLNVSFSSSNSDDWKYMEIKFTTVTRANRAWALRHRAGVNTEIPWPVVFNEKVTVRSFGGGTDTYTMQVFGFPDFYLAPSMGEIYIVPQDVTQWPTNSYISISSEDGYQEIDAYVGAAPAAKAYVGQGVYSIRCQLNLYGRGKAGTISRPLVWGCSGVPTDHGVAVNAQLSPMLSSDPLFNPKSMEVETLFYSDASFWAIVLSLMVSTYGGNNGTYDSYFQNQCGAGLAIDERHIDVGAFERLTATFTEFAMRPFLKNDMDFNEFLADHSFFAGYCILSGGHGKYYQIGPVEHAGGIFPVEALDGDDILWVEPPRVTGLGEVVNQVVVKLNYDPRTDQYTEPGITIPHLSSIADYGKSEAVEMRAQTIALPLPCQIVCAATHAAEVFLRCGEPRFRVRVAVGPIGWKLKPSQVVTLTHQAVWGMDGTRGVSDVAFLVTDVEKRFLGEGPGAIITLERRLDQQLTYWSPTATVSVIAGGGVTLTVNANSWTNANEQYTDAEYFETGYAVQATNMLLNVTVQAVVTNRVGNTITINAALPGPWVVGDVIYLWYDDWTNQTADQRLRSISQADASGYVSGTTEGYQWA